MVLEDFYKLRIGDCVYHNGRGRFIDYLSLQKGICRISFIDSLAGPGNLLTKFEDIMHDLSFEKPKDLGEEIADAFKLRIKQQVFYREDQDMWKNLEQFFRQADIRRKGE